MPVVGKRTPPKAAAARLDLYPIIERGLIPPLDVPIKESEIGALIVAFCHGFLVGSAGSVVPRGTGLLVHEIGFERLPKNGGIRGMTNLRYAEARNVFGV